MRSRQHPTKIFLFISSIFLMLMLSILTVSLPFAYSVKQMIDATNATSNFILEENEEEGDNLFANSTEEKASSNISSASEEYLHEIHTADHYLFALCKEYKVEHVSLYTAFYGELISPPPDVS